MDKQRNIIIDQSILTVLILFLILAGVYFGYIQELLLHDVSMISFVIFSMWAVITIVLFKNTWQLNNELKNTQKLYTILEHQYKNDDVDIEKLDLPEGLIGEYIQNLKQKNNLGIGKIDQSILLENLDVQLYKKIRWSFFLTNKITNLGLLGTAIGFAVALNALFEVESFDFETMKEILTQVAVGMGIALYTTISALLASVPLKAQTQVLESGVDHIINNVTKITEVYVIPSLERTNYEKNQNQ